MGLYVNPGGGSFSDARLNPAFTDKSELLHFTNGVLNDPTRKFMCVSCPRRFGKSTNAAMLTDYYSIGTDSASLFDDLKIAAFPDYMLHRNKYPLIYLDIQKIRSDYLSFPKRKRQRMELMEYLQNTVLLELAEEFPDISFLQKKNIDIGLPVAIGKICEKKKIRFIFVIDEWDCFFREEKNNLPLQEEYLNFLRSLFKGDLSEQCVHLAYMTGILPIKKYKTQSALNNVKEYSMVNPGGMAPYIGFTEPEIQVLCEKYQMDLNSLRWWYEGYRLAGTVSVYNPLSVVRALEDGELGNYWIETETFEDLKQYIDMDFDGLRKTVVQLLAGESVLIDTRSFQNDMVSLSSRDDVLTLLVHLGYLSFQNSGNPDHVSELASFTKNDASVGVVRIPNREIRQEFRLCLETMNWKPVSDALKLSGRLLAAAWRLDAWAVAEGMEKILGDSASLLACSSGESLRRVIQLAWDTALEYYTPVQEFPSGKGRADVEFLPLPGVSRIPMIVELKYNRSSRSAIRQIRNKNYAGKLTAYPEVLLVGIHYSQKTKKHTCRIEKWGF